MSASLPFVIGVWQQPASSAAKWKDRGVNTLFGHDTEGGKITKAQWEDQVASAGEYFITAPGADVATEASQPFRVGFNQPDEADLITHVNMSGSKIRDLADTYNRCKATGVPVWINLAGSAFDNIYYDGTPHPNAKDGQLAGHRAATGGYMAWGDRIGFDYYLWTTGRAGMFDITKRLMDRCNDWSGGKPIFVYVETCTQGTGKPFTADDYESQVWTITDYAKAKGYKLAGIIYFTQKVYPGWNSFDMTAPDVVDRMKVVNAKLIQMFGGVSQPADPAPPVVAAPDLTAVNARIDDLQKLVTEQAKIIADVATVAAQANSTLAKLKAVL